MATTLYDAGAKIFLVGQLDTLDALLPMPSPLFTYSQIRQKGCNECSVYVMKQVGKSSEMLR